MATTDYFYPDPHTENTSVDGYTAKNTAQFWADHIAAGGATANDTSADTYCVRMTSSSTTDKWQRLGRSHFLFDTSALDNAAVISSAVFSLMGSAKDDNMSQSIRLTSTAPAKNTEIATGDHVNVGTAAYAPDISLADFDTSHYNNWTLNATPGIAAISLTGITKLGIKLSGDADNIEPTWASNASAQAECRFADYALTTSDPKLAVTYTTGGTVYYQVCAATMACVATRAVTAKLSRSATMACVATRVRSAMTFHRSMSATMACVATKARKVSVARTATTACVATIARKISVVRARAMACVATIGKGVKLTRAVATACVATASAINMGAGVLYHVTCNAVMACVATVSRKIKLNRSVATSIIATISRLWNRKVSAFTVSETALPVYSVSESLPVYSVSETALPVYSVSEVVTRSEPA